MDKRIALIDQSALGGRASFYVGGEYAETDGKRFLTGQMFVEVYEPRERKHEYPVVMFHGAGQTNMNWLQTPDGRMGWADYFVSKGFCVVLAEQPSRGRSAYHPAAEGPRIFHPLQIVRQRFTTDEGPWPQAKKHTQWPENGGDWEDPAFRQFAAAQVEYLPGNKRSQALVLAAGKELLELLGPLCSADPFSGRPLRLAAGRCFPGKGKGGSGAGADRAAVLRGSEQPNSKKLWLCRPSAPF